MKKILTLAALLTGLSTPLSAHEDYRTVGIITHRYVTSDKQEMMEVTDAQKDTVTLWISKQTVVKQDDKLLTPAALKDGVTVVVDSYGDELDYSEALNVRIVPPIAAPK